MTKQEIKNLVAQKIAGQGSAVDAGSALPEILNGIVDAMPDNLDGLVLDISDWVFDSHSAIELTVDARKKLSKAIQLVRNDVNLSFDSLTLSTELVERVASMSEIADGFQPTTIMRIFASDRAEYEGGDFALYGSYIVMLKDNNGKYFLVFCDAN